MRKRQCSCGPVSQAESPHVAAPMLQCLLPCWHVAANVALKSAAGQALALGMKGKLQEVRETDRMQLCAGV